MTRSRGGPARTLAPTLALMGRRVSSFHACGVSGLLLGTCVALALARHGGLAPAVVIGLLASGVFAFLSLAIATRIVTGREELVYYHHEIAILTISGGLLAWLKLPLLPYLDVTALGLGVILACGRCGCLMVGCCHGKPWRWGIRYGAEHEAEGFPSCYVGVRLFPVQALEALVVALIVTGCAAAIVRGSSAGAALTWYVICYSVARIGLEELRGDSARPHWLRLSEAQWTSAVLIGAIVAGEWLGRFPRSRWHLLVAAGAGASLAALALARSAGRVIVEAHHAAEVAAILGELPCDDGPVTVRRTSLTVGIASQSIGAAGDPDGCVLFSLSRADRRLTLVEARALATLIVNVASRTRASTCELLRGGHGVFHLIVRGAA